MGITSRARFWKTVRLGITERDTKGKVWASFRLKQSDDHDFGG